MIKRLLILVGLMCSFSSYGSNVVGISGGYSVITSEPDLTTFDFFSTGVHYRKMLLPGFGIEAGWFDNAVGLYSMVLLMNDGCSSGPRFAMYGERELAHNVVFYGKIGGHYNTSDCVGKSDSDEFVPEFSLGIERRFSNFGVVIDSKFGSNSMFGVSLGINYYF